MKNFIKLDHIGKILAEEFMEPYNLSQNALAKAIGVVDQRAGSKVATGGTCA